ncbi:unnamed protein product [Schistosoma curassoni]|uniref:Uncharacterized protein n=1 Tax=Schistosoma curassoni TaxID=6186 RepID=A0A183JV55_9TREM|nr:unnamed protein product [Schistosoma curassoni]
MIQMKHLEIIFNPLNMHYNKNIIIILMLKQNCIYNNYNYSLCIDSR